MRLALPLLALLALGGCPEHTARDLRLRAAPPEPLTAEDLPAPVAQGRGPEHLRRGPPRPIAPRWIEQAR